MKITTIAIIFNKTRDAFLMGYHMRGEGKGKLNFIGGKVGDKPEFGHETPEESVRREIREEAGVVPISLVHCADIFYHYLESLQGKEEVMKIYKVDRYRGVEKQNPDEFQLKWIKIDWLPLEQMWESDRLWLPKILHNKQFQKIEFFYDVAGRLVDEKYQ